jgi:hypothetical protein
VRAFLLTAVFLASSLAADPVAIGGTPVQVFRASTRSFGFQPTVVYYQAAPETLQILLPGFKVAGPLNARLQLTGLPHYQEWVAKQAGADLRGKAIRALLDEIQDRPVVALTLGPLPAEGPAEIRLGLMDGHRFELYARVLGTAVSSRQGWAFEARSLSPENTTASAAWAVLAPLARSQAGRIAGQRLAAKQ